MNVETWAFVMVGLSFALYIGVAVWSRASSTDEFYVAGGRVPPLINGMATAADWMSAASFISMAGLISFMGRDGSVYLMGWTGGYVLLALLLARAVVVISPHTSTSPVVVAVSQATREFGSWASIASRIASETWSHILSGCPMDTDSEVNIKREPIATSN